MEGINCPVFGTYPPEIVFVSVSQIVLKPLYNLISPNGIHLMLSFTYEL